MNKDYFKIFSNCVITKGINRHLISDLQQGETHLISNDLLEVIDMASFQEMPISEIRELYDVDNAANQRAITEYFNFLKSNNLGFYCSKENLKLFPPLNMVHKSPYKINNAILEISDVVFDNADNILTQLDSLGCKFLSVIIYDQISIEDLLKLDNKILQLDFISYDLYISYETYTSQGVADRFKGIQHKITGLNVFSCPQEKHDEFIDDFFLSTLFTSKKIKDFKHCGVVDLKYFNTNITKFTESVNHNSCLHKKITVDRFGDIKNCPSMTESFGNINEVSLEKALLKPHFKKYWDITKDQIEICKDCEFRHICTDCRAFTDNPSDSYSKPLKCGYNPHTNVWEDWSTNPLKQKAITHYGLEELINRHD